MNNPTAATILLIDDSASVRDILRLALESEGYEILEPFDGRGGVSLSREQDGRRLI